MNVSTIISLDCEVYPEPDEGTKEFSLRRSTEALNYFNKTTYIKYKISLPYIVFRKKSIRPPQS